MSFSTSHTNVMSTGDILEEKVVPSTERHLLQFRAGRDCALLLMESGVVGEGPFQVSISGHAGSTEGGVSGDSVAVSVMKAYPTTQG